MQNSTKILQKFWENAGKKFEEICEKILKRFWENLWKIYRSFVEKLGRAELVHVAIGFNVKRLPQRAENVCYSFFLTWCPYVSAWF